MLKHFYQQLIQLAQCQHPTVVDLHKLLDSQRIAVGHVPRRSQFFLMVEQQSIIGATRHGVQCKPNLTQKFLPIAQLVALGVTQKVRLIDFAEPGAKAPQRDPLNDLKIPEASGRAFNIRFQGILGVAVSIVAILLFPEFAADKGVGGPHARRLC